ARRVLLGGLDHGMPRGDGGDLPPPRKFVPGWTIGRPDMVVTLPNAFDVPAKMPRRGIPYKYFTVDPGLKEDHWVVRAEARAGAPAVVHHVVVFVVPPGEKFF